MKRLQLSAAALVLLAALAHRAPGNPGVIYPDAAPTPTPAQQQSNAAEEPSGLWAALLDLLGF